MTVEIDSESGFCFGVTRAINKAEEELSHADTLYCLGDIVHNGSECERLRQMGLISVSNSDLDRLSDTKLLLRAHGEPPSTYRKAESKNITIIDATCPVVLHLQKRIKSAYEEILSMHQSSASSPQIVIYGKPGHAEVIGLVGQTDGTAIVIENLSDASTLDFTRDILLYSQTTKSLEGFQQIVDYIKSCISEGVSFRYYDTICRQVANRISNIRAFADSHDAVLFVCGTKSSNGRVLFNECHDANPRSYMVNDSSEIDMKWFDGVESIGICGATSTPKWLMEQCRDRITASSESCRK